MATSRLEWKDTDWARYLDCSVQKIPEFRKVLSENYVTAVGQDKKTNLYSFVLYRYDFSIAGTKRVRLLLSDDKNKFNDFGHAVQHANNIISTLELSDIWAEALNVPKRAIQMMLIREK